MEDLTFITPPPTVAAILEETARMGFGMASEPFVGAFLRVKRGARTTLAGPAVYEKVIENIDPCQCSRRKAWIELCEADGSFATPSNENNGLIVLKAIQKEPSNSIGLACLPVELTVAIEQRHQAINIRDGGWGTMASFARLRVLPVRECERRIQSPGQHD